MLWITERSNLAIKQTHFQLSFITCLTNKFISLFINSIIFSNVLGVGMQWPVGRIISQEKKERISCFFFFIQPAKAPVCNRIGGKKILIRSVRFYQLIIKGPCINRSPPRLFFSSSCLISRVPKIDCTPKKSGKMIEATIVWIKNGMMLTRPPSSVPGRF